MAKGSGGAGRGGRKIPSSNIGRWINFKDGRRRIGIRFGSAITEGNKVAYPYKINVQQSSKTLISSSSLYSPSNGKFYNSEYEFRKGVESGSYTNLGADVRRYVIRAARRGG